MAPHSRTLGKSHGWRSLVGCSSWGHEESDTTERLHFHFSLSCIGEGNGNPLQCSCVKNPRDREAWWAAVYGVAQSRTRLKQLSSSSSGSSNTCSTVVYGYLKSPLRERFLFIKLACGQRSWSSGRRERRNKRIESPGKRKRAAFHP